MQNQVNILCDYKTKELWFSLDLGGPSGRGGSPSLVDLPTLSHHTLAAAVGGRLPGLPHLALDQSAAARPAALPTAAAAVVVAVVQDWVGGVPWAARLAVATRVAAPPTKLLGRIWTVPRSYSCTQSWLEIGR